MSLPKFTEEMREKMLADLEAGRCQLCGQIRPPAGVPEQEPVALRELLESFRYQSSSGRGERGLMKHHIDALVKYLAPYFRSTPPPEQPGR